MLTLTQLSGFGGGSGIPSTLYQILTDLSLTANLVVCLDAGDGACYDGSSQTWTDRVGGNNYFLGTTSGSDATDPTFNGSAGSASSGEYFSFDGGDFFKYTAAHTFADTWHRNNGAFSILAVVYTGSSKAASTRIFDTMGALSAKGVAFEILSTRVLRFRHAYDNTPTMETRDGTATVSTSSWNFVAVAYDEATPTVDIVTNSTAETPSAPTASTATGVPGASPRIGSYNDTPSNPFESGERLAMLAVFSSKLTTTQLGNIYTALKAQRFTTLP